MAGAGDLALAVQFPDIAQIDEDHVIVFEKADRLLRLDKPVIAMLRGWCLGGGVLMALCADIRIAADDLQIGIPACCSAARSVAPYTSISVMTCAVSAAWSTAAWSRADWSRGRSASRAARCAFSDQRRSRSASATTGIALAICASSPDRPAVP